ncbi:MAG TPA: M23 family metallopeptidase [Solirubrobacteraceae bacterium]|nr:M23 family metallopeptidase [Solirubrobacteraceae bacterium]
MWRLWAVLGVLGLAMALVVFAAVAGFASPACTSPSGPVGGVPAALVPIFEGAAGRYNLGPEGAAILAAINFEESNFGQSTLPGVQSGANRAGAAGPMQIGISGVAGDTWDGIKVNAPSDPPGQAPSVYDEGDAVYSAAHYLAKEGLTAAPASWPRAVFGYNHADWYVQAVLARARGYYQQGLSGADQQGLSGAGENSATLSAGWPGEQQCSVQADGYVNPFAQVPPGHLVAERIDQGVDYADNTADPILALGDALVTYAGPDPGWYGYSVNYTLADGPYAGRYVYVSESVTPTVHAGQHVMAGQEIATFGEPNTHGIETGWAAGPGLVVSRASALGQPAQGGDPGDNLTYCGNNFSELLGQLGAPPGLAEGRPVVGGGC